MGDYFLCHVIKRIRNGENETAYSTILLLMKD
jgi:hypothetical protein